MKSAKLNTRENYKLTKPRNPRKLIPAKINPYKVNKDAANGPGNDTIDFIFIIFTLPI